MAEHITRLRAFRQYKDSFATDELKDALALLDDYDATVKRLNEAGHLLDDALTHLCRTYHADNCPRGVDDYECVCGLSDIKDRVREFLRNG